MDQKVTEKLLEIHDENGKLTPPDVVEAAKPKNSVLHPYFEWDDETAGYAYRLWQARQLIRHIVVEIQNDGGKKEHIFFHTVDEDGEPAYQTKTVLLSQPNFLKAAIERAKEKLEGIQDAFEELLELAKTERQRKKFKKASDYVKRATETMV